MAGQPSYEELQQQVQRLREEVSERRQDQVALRLQKVYLEHLLDVAPEAVVLADRDHRITRINAQFTRLFGYTPEEALGRTCDELIAPPERIEEAVGITQGVGRGEAARVETVRRTKDGTPVYVELMAAPVMDEDKHVGDYVSYRDVSERRRREEALRRENAYLSSLHETILGLMSRLDLDDLLEAVCARAGSLAGTSNAFVYLLDPDTDELVIRLGLGFYENAVGFRLKRGEGLGGKILETGAPLGIDDYSTWSNRSADPRFDNLHSIIGAPLKTGDRVRGVIGLSHTDPNKTFEEDDIGQLRQFAELASIALDNAYLYRDLQRELIRRSQIEQELRESEARHRSVFENTGAATVIIEEDRTLSMVNTEFENLSGYSRVEIEGKKKWTDFVVREDMERMKGYHEERRQNGSEAPVEYEFQFLDRQASVKYVLLRIGIIPGTKKAVASLVDITPRRRSEDQLRESEERFRTLIEHSPLGLSLIGKDGRYKYVNPKFVEIFGYTLEDVPTGREWFQRAYPDPDLRSQVISTWKTDTVVLGVGEVQPREFPVTCKDGAVKVIQIRTAKLATGEYLVIFVDVGEQRRLESQLRQAQKMEAVGTLAGGVAHDFNNLLQAVLGYTQMLILDKESGDPELAKLKEIEKAAKRGSELTLQLLTFSRKVESKLRPVDLNQEVRQVGRLLERTLPKMIAIEFYLQEGLPIIRADPTQIEQILMNLALNAMDAMPEGGRLVIETQGAALNEEYCRTHLGAESGEYLILTVSDTGLGMDEETVKRIFEPFFTTKETGRGTGLGLSMVYGIVKNHGGYIMCYSERGEGTTFKVYFPVSEKKLLETQARGEQGSFEGGTETILLVDDEKSLRELGEQMLAKFGYAVLTCPDGESALEIYRKRGKEIHLVILDLIMPGIGGKRCLDALLKMDPAAKVVIASGYSVNGRAKQILDAGVRGFISKPYEIRQMLRVVREALDKK
ncbi:MAG: PAS domain S-box protein [Deltaproteobacteria bacterium]|nr:PAS domain S-box protein [Deltaproteobacteria bacterium]